jgi:hypothetical protein
VDHPAHLDGRAAVDGGGCLQHLRERWSSKGKLSTVEEYMAYATKIDYMAPEIYKYLNFDKMDKYLTFAERGQEIAIKLIA